MIKRIVCVTALLCASVAFGQTKTPLDNPHWNFFDQNGIACAGCSLGTFLAGTTTPTPTWQDAAGISTNTNPIILDTSGGAFIRFGPASIKLVLKDALGSIIWTADNISPSGGSGGGCSVATAITFENSTVTGLDCDSLITINKLIHAINVGGPLPANHATITNLSTVTASWTFDITNKNTAFASIQPLTTKGDLLGYGTAAGRLGVGADGTTLIADSTQTLGFKWGTPAAGINQITGDGTAGPGSGSQAFTLATVNSGPGTCGDSAHVCQITTNGKGLVTGQTPVAVGTAPAFTSGTNGWSEAFSCTVATVAHTCLREHVNTGALNNNTTTTVTLPATVPTAIFSIVCSDNGSRVQSGNDQAVGANISGQSSPYSTIQVNTPASSMSAYCEVTGY